MLRLQLKVVPKSSADRIWGWIGDRLKVQVTAAPERGKANEAVVELIAATLGVPRRAVRITAGAASPLKTLEVDAGEEVWAKLPGRP